MKQQSLMFFNTECFHYEKKSFPFEKILSDLINRRNCFLNCFHWSEKIIHCSVSRTHPSHYYSTNVSVEDEITVEVLKVWDQWIAYSIMVIGLFSFRNSMMNTNMCINCVYVHIHTCANACACIAYRIYTW